MSTSDTNDFQTDDQVVIARVGIKAPEFWRTEPELWFLRLEAQFRQAKITSDDCKFDHTVTSLNSEVLLEVADILRNPTRGRAYEDLKTRLLDRYGSSADDKIHQLMEMTLGDLKPTQLLHRMQALASNNVSTQVLKKLWLDRLPPQARAVIAILDGDLEELAKKADKYIQCSSFPIMAMDGKPALNNKVSVDEKTDGHCYYHRRFGSQAKKCRAPCTFSKNDQEGAQ